MVVFSRWCFYVAFVSVTTLALVPQDHAVITTGWDKANHVLAFFVLLGLLDSGYPSWPLWSRKVILLLAYGALIECLQGLLAERTLSLLDVVADLMGLLAYSLCRPWLLDKLPFIDARLFR